MSGFFKKISGHYAKVLKCKVNVFPICLAINKLLSSCDIIHNKYYSRASIVRANSGQA